MAKPYQDSRSVQLDGPAPFKDLKVAHFKGREPLSRPFQYDVALYGSDNPRSDGAIDADKVLGRSATVALVTDASGGMRYFNGIVTEFAHIGFTQRCHQYRAVLRPAFWMLTRRADCRVFQKKSTPDIFAEVCRQAGSITHRLALSARYEAWDYRVQYRETDFDFLSRLLEHEGIYYYFEHAAGRHTMVLTDDVGKLTSASGYEEVPYYPASSTPVQRERDNLSEWTVSKSFQAAAFASLEYNFETPAADVYATSPVARREDPHIYELFDYPAGSHQLTSASVQKLAKVRAEQLHAAQAVSRSEGDAAGLGAGRLFKLTGHPRKDFNKKYLVVDAAIEIASEPVVDPVGIMREPTRHDASAQVHVAIECVEADSPWRPERSTPKPVIQGAQTARVVGPGNREIWTDKYGCVKVQFHWDRAGRSDDTSSCWVRVASTWAGKNWGAQHVPRVGQEVVVSFLEGDPDRPLVIGSVYNGENLPPYELPANGTRSGVKSRVSADGTAENFNELRFEDKKGQEEIYLHAERNMQVIVENNQTISIGATKKDEGDRTTTIQHDDKLTVGNDLTSEIKGKETHTVTKDRATNAKENDTLDVGKKYTLTAADQITLECGAAKIVLKKDGTVEISGSKVKVNSDDSADLNATRIAIKGKQVEVEGTATAVKATAKLDLTAGAAAALKGAVTQIG